MATDLDDYLASRKYEEQYHGIDTFADVILGFPVKEEDNNSNDKGKVKRGRRSRKR